MLFFLTSFRNVTKNAACNSNLGMDIIFIGATCSLTKKEGEFDQLGIQMREREISTAEKTSCEVSPNICKPTSSISSSPSICKPTSVFNQFHQVVFFGLGQIKPASAFQMPRDSNLLYLVKVCIYLISLRQSLNIWYVRALSA